MLSVIILHGLFMFVLSFVFVILMIVGLDRILERFRIEQIAECALVAPMCLLEGSLPIEMDSNVQRINGEYYGNWI